MTLVELLVVILILGILAAVALPNYFGAENDARVSVDKANVQAINTALALYRFRNNRCPADRDEFQRFLKDERYFPDGAPTDPIDGTDRLPGDPGYTDYPADYNATNCRLTRD